MRTICAALALFPLLHAADLEAEGRRWWSRIEILAADNMEGRNTGSEAYKRAAQYVASEFERAGLKAAGVNGYFQPLKFRVRQIDESRSSLALVRAGKPEPLVLGDDANFQLRTDLAASIDAPAVFVGHGLSIPEAGHNDFEGLDLRGKIAVYLAGGPPSIPSAVKAHFSSRGERWAALKRAGAVGIAEIPNPKSMDIPWARSTLARLNPAMSLLDARFDEQAGLQLSLQVNPERAEKLFAGSGHTFQEVLAAAAAKKPLPRFPLEPRIRAVAAVTVSEAESPNVVALFPGSDPKLKDEFVVLSAHLDHVGVGQPIDGDRIYNGAMDNSAGVASLIEIANLLKEASIRTKRSLVFLALTGEEKGLTGSRFFATYPTIKKENIVANINLDMFLPLFPLKYLEVQGVDDSTLGEAVRRAAARSGVEVHTDKEPDRVLFIRSDQYSFVRQGVPALAFKFSYTSGSPEEATAKEWLKKRYHAPSDDLAQPVDKAGAAKFNRLILDLTQDVANDSARPRWKDSSFFKRFAAPSAR